MLGGGLACALLASAMTKAGIGGAFFFAMWGVAAVLAAPLAVGVSRDEGAALRMPCCLYCYPCDLYC